MRVIGAGVKAREQKELEAHYKKIKLVADGVVPEEKEGPNILLTTSGGQRIGGEVYLKLSTYV